MIHVLNSPNSLVGLYIGNETAAEATKKFTVHDFVEVATINVANQNIADLVLAKYHELNAKARRLISHPIYDVGASDAVRLLNQLVIEHTTPTKSKRKSFTFDDLKIKPGSILASDKTNKTLIVVWDNKVLLEGEDETMSLTAATVATFGQRGDRKKRAVKIANVKEYWFYNGVKLNDLYERLYSSEV